MRFLIWLVVLFWALGTLRRLVVWVLRTFANSLTGNQAPPRDQGQALSSRRLVRDPVCGVHVTEDRAIPVQVAGEVVYFCSAKCRDQYAGHEQKFAANG